MVYLFFPPAAMIPLAAGLTALGGAVGYWFGDPATGFSVGALMAVLLFIATFVTAYVQVRKADRRRARLLRSVYQEAIKEERA